MGICIISLMKGVNCKFNIPDMTQLRTFERKLLILYEFIGKLVPSF